MNRLFQNITLLLILGITPLFAQDITLQKQGSLTFFKQPALSVAIMGQFAYVGTRGSGIQVTDISDTLYPEVVSTFSEGHVLGIELVNEVGFSAVEGRGIDVFDFSDPDRPFVADFIEIPSIRKITQNEGKLYVAAGLAGVYELTYEIPEMGVVRHFEIKDGEELLEVEAVTGTGDNLAIITGDMIYSVSISNPNSPSIIGQGPMQGDWRQLHLVGTTLYSVLSSAHGGASYLFALSFSNPSQIGNLGSAPFAGTASDMLSHNGVLYVSATEEGLRVYDISQGLSELHYFKEGLAVMDFAYDGNRAVLASLGHGVTIIGMADPQKPKPIGSYTGTGAMIHDVGQRGDYIYLHEYYRGMVVIDNHNPNHPKEIGRLWSGSTSIGLDITGDYAYIVNTGRGLISASLTTPDQPELTGISRPFYANKATYAGDRAFVLDGRGGYRIINIKNPYDLKEEGYYQVEDTLTAIALTDYFIYTVSRSRVLTISDYRQGGIPKPRLTYTFAYPVNHIVPYGQTLLVTSTGDGLHIIDISNEYDPQDPMEVSSVGGEMTWDVELVGNHAVLVQNKGIQVVDVSKPYVAHQVAYFPGNYYSVSIDSNRLTAIGDDYLHTFTLSGLFTSVSEDDEAALVPHNVTLTAPYPNPFNSTTSLGFNLAEPGNVNLWITDVSGRSVARLFDGWLPAGDHSQSVNGLGLSAGTYFGTLRYENGDNKQTVRTKMMLVK